MLGCEEAQAADEDYPGGGLEKGRMHNLFVFPQIKAAVFSL